MNNRPASWNNRFTHDTKKQTKEHRLLYLVPDCSPTSFYLRLAIKSLLLFATALLLNQTENRESHAETWPLLFDYFQYRKLVIIIGFLFSRHIL